MAAKEKDERTSIICHNPHPSYFSVDRSLNFPLYKSLLYVSCKHVFYHLKKLFVLEVLEYDKKNSHAIFAFFKTKTSICAMLYSIQFVKEKICFSVAIFFAVISLFCCNVFNSFPGFFNYQIKSPCFTTIIPCAPG
jgi:hypothetical protein